MLFEAPKLPGVPMNVVPKVSDYVAAVITVCEGFEEIFPSSLLALCRIHLSKDRQRQG